MDSHNLATELDRIGTAPVFIRINGELYEIDGCCDGSNDKGEEIILLGEFNI